MQDFESTTETTEKPNEERASEKFGVAMKQAFKKFVLFISFGPGILGFLWLLGKIFKR